MFQTIFTKWEKWSQLIRALKICEISTKSLPFFDKNTIKNTRTINILDVTSN